MAPFSAARTSGPTRKDIQTVDHALTHSVRKRIFVRTLSAPSVPVAQIYLGHWIWVGFQQVRARIVIVSGEEEWELT